MKNNIKKKYIYHLGKFIFQSKKFFLTIVIIIVALIIILVNITNKETTNIIDSIDRWWGNFWDPVIGLLTFLIAIIVAIQNIISEFQNKIEKRLTVHFKYGEKYILTCHEAYLAGEDDIRQWGLQIASQMAKNGRLKFYPYITQGKTTNIFKNKLQKFIKLYTVTFYFKDIPQYDPINEDNIDNNILESLRNKYNFNTIYCIWIDNYDDSPKNEELILQEQPNAATSIEETKILLKKNLENEIPNK